jgi:GNAT superfamily N-acetyltransferase
VSEDEHGDVVIRAARLDERDALVHLMWRSKAHWGYDDDFLAACRVVLDVSPDAIAAGRVLAAERAGVVVGVAAVTGSAVAAELDVCFVDPPAIGTGVGRALVDASCALARVLGAQSLRVESDPNAETFYATMGAVRVGDVASGVDPNRRLPVLRFDLDH